MRNFSINSSAARPIKHATTQSAVELLLSLRLGPSLSAVTLDRCLVDLKSFDQITSRVPRNLFAYEHKTLARKGRKPKRIGFAAFTFGLPFSLTSGLRIDSN